MGATVVFIIIGLPVILYALLRGYQLLLMQMRYEALMLERKMMLEQGVPPEQLPPIPTPETPSLLPFSLPPLGERTGEGERRWLGGLPPVAVLLLLLGTVMILVGMASLNDAVVIMAVILLGIGVLLSLPPRRPRTIQPTPAADAGPVPPPVIPTEGVPTSPVMQPSPAAPARNGRSQGWSIAGIILIGTTLFIVGLIMTIFAFGNLQSYSPHGVLGLIFMAAGLWLYLRYAAPRPVPLTAEELAAIPRGNLYAYLKASILSLGVAGGLWAIMQWGRFDTPEQAAMSLALFPLAMSLAFLATHLVMSILDDRIDRVNSIVFLALLALGMNAFPLLYRPNLTLEDQVNRLAVIPVAIAAALLVTALLRLFLRRERKGKPIKDDGEETIVLR